MHTAYGLWHFAKLEEAVGADIGLGHQATLALGSWALLKALVILQSMHKLLPGLYAKLKTRHNLSFPALPSLAFSWFEAFCTLR